MDRRESIVTAALDVIAEGGLASFTQPRVARRAGLRQSHLTYYFPTRDDLLFAVADEAVERRVAALETASVSTDEPHEKLTALTRVLCSPEQTRVLIALTQSADQHEAVRASFGTLARRIAPLSASLLEAFHVRVSEDSLALLQATSTGIAVLSLAHGAEDAVPLARHLLEEFLAGLAAETAEGRRAPADS